MKEDNISDSEFIEMVESQKDAIDNAIKGIVVKQQNLSGHQQGLKSNADLGKVDEGLGAGDQRT